MRLTVIGCSGSVPGPDSPSSCYLLEAEDPADPTGRTWRVVLDLGSGASGPLQRYLPGGDLTTLDGVLLSHLHADHCLDTTALYVALKYGPAAYRGQPVPPVPLWAPADAPGRLARAYDLPADGPGMTEQFTFGAWTDGVPVRVGPFTVEPSLVAHPVEAYGLRITGPSDGGGTAVLAYTGDTDECPALDHLAADVDLFLTEATFTDDVVVEPGVHLSGVRAGVAAARAGARSVLVTHLPPWADAPAVLAEVRSRYDGPAELARPGTTHTL
ncbi:Ribonuclease BN, tRNA processing enzyme [Quadrisphaera granulorum]|uniref:Ribonuclease BN (tRNA processing enzyme) n=1 Tax=Quadrisphaera granulorum TaxID=317664 RepID=A0A316AB81_9ACTN|nr:MBL fold metallo-hydrolase [Quadrisphaera granulorum]PWJ54891.1 ribonuclease BN (tRNA processing enzyme) [Quadrisphaera granulorum]SZE95837.1 Ribonuclease BN, tRNA processing enzyme [Quadrisphaera granulorum]